MQFPLNHFEQYIDEAILKRGLSYFKKGHVISFDEITQGEYEAVVIGTDEYLVRLKVKSRNVIENSCTCPYDMGSVCKHIVAVLFYMQQEELGLKPADKEQAKRKAKSKKKTVSEQVDEILDKLSHDDLKKFLKELTLNDPSFRRLFLANFMFKFTAESPALYSQQIKAILKNAMGRDRYIQWSRVASVGNAVYRFLETAMKHEDEGNYLSAIYICEAVAVEMLRAFEIADDSDGDIGGNIDAAFDILGSISTKELPEEVRLYLFEQCKFHYLKGTFNGWDWHLYLLDIATRLAVSDKEASDIFSLLEIPGESNYYNDQIVKMRYDLIRKMKGEEAAEKFAEQNLDNSDLRRKSLDKALKEKQFDKAIILASDGIDLDLKNKPGLAMEWYDWLLRISLTQKDKPKIIEYARFLFIDGFRHDQDYYGILKKNIAGSDWDNFVEGLIKELSSSKGRSRIDVIAKIYITEQWWERLLKLITDDPSIHKIQSYESYLADKYPNEVALLYEKGVLSYMERASDRGHYKDACRILRRMIKLGARDRVISLVEKFRKEYPRRVALMDELDKV